MAQFELICGDSFAWLRDQPDNSIHGVITDPPYAVFEYEESELAKLAAGRGGVWRIPPKIGGTERSPLPRFTVYGEDELEKISLYFENLSKELLPKLVPGAHVFMAASTQLSHLAFSAMCRGGLERRGEVVRLVRTLRGGDRPKNAHEDFPDLCVSPRSCWEPWGLFRKPIEGRVQDNLRKWKTGCLRRLSDDTPFLDIVPSERTPRRERDIVNHPSLKPQSFLRHLARHILPFNEGRVFDPFAGSGSTLAACLAVEIDSVGVERNVGYYSQALEAIPKLARLDVGANLSATANATIPDSQMLFSYEIRSKYQA